MAPPRHERPGFSRRAQYGIFFGYILAIAGAVVGAVLLLLSTFNPAAFAAARMGIAELTGPVSTGMSAIVRVVAAIPETIGTFRNVYGKNARLRADVVRSRRALYNGRVAVRENARLRRLLAVRDGNGTPIVTARIVSSSASSTRRFGLLNAGRWQGVRPGQPVRGPDGLIGRTVETGPNSARVLLLTDSESMVPVRRLGDGLPALAAGRGDGLVEIRAATLSNARLRRGDIFVTSGTGGIFVPDVPVARVVRAGADTAPANPFAHPDTLDFAMVLRAFLPPPPPPASTLPPAPPVAGDTGATP